MRFRRLDWRGIEFKVYASWPYVACMRFQMTCCCEIREPVFVVDEFPETTKQLARPISRNHTDGQHTGFVWLSLCRPWRAQAEPNQCEYMARGPKPVSRSLVPVYRTSGLSEASHFAHQEFALFAAHRGIPGISKEGLSYSLTSVRYGDQQV
jgi:hypothetical protein